MYDRSAQIKDSAIFFFVLSWVSVSLRVYVKARLLKQFGWDDAAMMACLMFYTGYLTCCLAGVAHGSGQHRAAITDGNAQTALMFWFFCELFYTIATCVCKISIGLFFLRIAVKKWHIKIIKVIMYCTAVLGIIYSFVSLFQCKPISFWWDLNPDAQGTCLSPDVMADTTYVIGALNSGADWIFGILPIFIVKDLQMKGHTKIVVAVILGFAAIGSAATIIRMPYVWTLKEYKGEFLWRTADVAIWSTVEVGIGITAGNAATLRPLLRRFSSILGITSTTGFAGTSGWNKSGRHSSRGYVGSKMDTPLDDFARKGTTTTITIRGGATSPTNELNWALNRSDSEEEFMPESRGFGAGILRGVQINTTEERASSTKTPETDDCKNLPTRPIQAFERF